MNSKLRLYCMGAAVLNGLVFGRMAFDAGLSFGQGLLLVFAFDLGAAVLACVADAAKRVPLRIPRNQDSLPRLLLQAQARKELGNGQY